MPSFQLWNEFKISRKGGCEQVDGFHIQCLELTFLYRYCPGLIEAGYVYAACPPLYKVYKGKGKGEEVHYLYSDEELAAFNTEGYLVQRYKGLGEMDAEQLWETTMNPETRKLKKITVENAERADKLISAWMGKDVTIRKEFIFNELGVTKEGKVA